MKLLASVLLAIATMGVLLASCGGPEQGERGGATSSPFVGQRIFVAAAADLRFALEELAAHFERDCGCSVELTFGSSGSFASQLQQGFPADVFFSANVGFVESLEAQGLIEPGTKQLYAVGRIVLAKNKNVGTSVTTLQDLVGSEIRRVSIANPLHAPYGVAAQEALTNAGVWAAVQARLVMGENASQATQFIETGDAQAGIVPLSLAIRLQDRLTYVLIDASQHSPLNQGVAVMRRSRNPELAKAFIAYVTGPQGREVLMKYGFEPPL